MAVRAAMVAARRDAALNRPPHVAQSRQLLDFCTWICVVCRTYSVWDSGSDSVVVGTLFVVYCYHEYPQQSQLFIHGAL